MAIVFGPKAPDVESETSERPQTEDGKLMAADSGKGGVSVGKSDSTGKGKSRKRPVSAGQRMGSACSTPVKRGRPRLGEVDRTIERAAPWVALGMSRATWYKERRAKSEASKGKKE